MHHTANSQRPARTPGRGRPARRAAVGVTTLLAVAIMTACSGGTHNPTVSATPSASPSGTGGVSVAYSHCMRAHGVPDFPDPDSNGGISVHASSGSGALDPNSPQYQAAQTACASLAPGGGTAADQSKGLANAVKYAACMRAHGVTNFPDPTLVNGQIEFQGQGGIGRSPQFPAAQSACQPVLSGSGNGS